MNYILGLDASEWQGTGIDFNAVKNDGYQFWITRVSASYPTRSFYDATANANYYGAKAAGLIAGGYHKVGWTDPTAEADFFLKGMQPYEQGDLFAYDIEPNSDVVVPENWSQWEEMFVNRVHDKTGVWPFRYTNISMRNAMPPVGVIGNCAEWVAAPSYDFTASVPVDGIIAIQQGAAAHVAGVTANIVDVNAFYGTREQLLAYGYHAPAAEVPATPTPTPPTETPVPPVESPAPDQPVEQPATPPVVEEPTPPAQTPPEVDDNTPLPPISEPSEPAANPTWRSIIIAILVAILNRLRNNQL